MTDKNKNINRRKVLGITGGALLYSSIGTSSAKEDVQENKTPSHTIPHDVSITNNGTEKHKLTFTLTDIDSGEVEYKHQVVLAGLNDQGKNNKQSVKKRLNINVPTSRTYEVKLESDNSNSKTAEWYIPQEGTGHISFSASLSPDEEIKLSEKIV